MVVSEKTSRRCRAITASFDEIRYFFYLTNDRTTALPDSVFLANDRCNQENLDRLIKHGVGATRMPVDTLRSNWGCTW